MKALWFVGLLPSLVLAQGYAPRSTGGVTAAQTVAAVQDAGTLLRADRDAHAATFVATGQSMDGGVAQYAYACNQSPCGWKMGGGTQETLNAHDNEMHWGGAHYFATAFFQQPACFAGQTCRWFADTGSWFGVFPSADVSGCSAGTEGGIKANSATHRATYCDGTTPQELTYREAWSSSLDFGTLSAGTCADLTFTATNAVANEAVACGGLAAVALQDAGLYAMCGVSATNTGFVRACCQRLLASCGNPSAVTFTITAVR